MGWAWADNGYMTTPAVPPTKSWLDNIPASLRHVVLLAISALLAWATIDLPNWHLPTQVGLLIGVVLTYAVAWVTPLTRQYGVGASEGAGLG